MESSAPFAEQPFAPIFGQKPRTLVGRDQALGDFLAGLAQAPGSWQRVFLVSGQRGMGKTSFLQECAGWAEGSGFTTLFASPDEDISADLAAISAQRKVLVCVDNVRSATGGIRRTAAAYLALAAAERDVALMVAGPTQALRAALNDSVLARLKRSTRIALEALPSGRVQAHLAATLQKAGVSLGAEEARRAAAATAGHPFLLQLVGWYLCAGLSLDQATAASQADFQDQLIQPVLATLSAGDLAFLHAMAAGEGPCSMAQLRERTGKADNYLQPYRARLIKAGVVVSPRRGQLAFALPCLQSYLLEHPCP